MKKAYLLVFFILLLISLQGQSGVINGTIFRYDSVPLSGVEVRLKGTAPDTVFTDSAGQYRFEAPPGTYEVEPYSNSDFLNGVNELDRKMVSMHILLPSVGRPSPFTSPYQWIAADINNSRSVTTLDLIALAKLIDSTENTFPNNTSWQFIPADVSIVIFNQMAVIDSFPETSHLVLSAGQTITQDFKGVKIGDVDNSAFVHLENLHLLKGNLRLDTNGDCIPDLDTFAYPRFFVKLTNAEDTAHILVGKNGNFAWYLPEGTYRAELMTPNGLWRWCEDALEVVVAGESETEVAWTVTPAVACPYLEVDVSTPFLRRCFDNTYYVQYCNVGTTTAENAFVEIELDSFLQFNSSSIPGNPISTNRYRFNIGTVGIGVCQTFTFNVKVSCDAALGQTHCIEANIYPRPSCASPDPAWDGASLEVEARCHNDSVQFEIKNVGSPMRTPTNYIVIEDDLVMMQRSLQLDAGETRTVLQPANGATYLLKVAQTAAHPFSTFVSAAVEGCGRNEAGTVSYGFVNQFPLSDEAPFQDIECQDNRGAFDPNDKQAAPQGVSDDHLIEANTDLEYYIRFQNTGTDTAFTVVIRDTLADQLDLSSIIPGASSHEYTYFLENKVLTFVFANIALPDSNVNEPASHGFVKFRIAQRPNNPIGTQLANQAAIYFDFNAPIITNTVQHRIGKEFLGIISQTNHFAPIVQVTVYPNPFTQTAHFLLHAKENLVGMLRVFDIAGKLVQQQAFAGHQFDFTPRELLPGFYQYEIIANNQRVSVGKLLLQKKE